MSSKDYLDVSSEEEPTKNILEKKFQLKNDNNIINNDYSNHSYKNGEKYENKYYHKNRKGLENNKVQENQNFKQGEEQLMNEGEEQLMNEIEILRKYVKNINYNVDMVHALC